MNMEAFYTARALHEGLGWGRASRLLVDLGIDRQFGVSGPRRIRVKKLRRLLQRAMFQMIVGEGS